MSFGSLGIVGRSGFGFMGIVHQQQSETRPDTPQNRVTIKRMYGQLSTQVVVDDNTSLIDKIFSLCYPCLINRQGIEVVKLDKNDQTKTTDGLPVDLTDWSMPAMVAVGGYWKKYEFDSSSNTKLFKFSPYKVKGYRYVRKRFLNMFGGSIANVDGVNYLTSNSDRWTTQSVSLINYHAYAKNLGNSFRAIAMQDREVYRDMFYLLEQTYNSQSKFNGIVGVNGTNWAAFNRSADGGQSSYGQFHKTGETLSILSHKGERDFLVSGFPNGNITVKPYKWLWRENMLSGPYWIRETGFLRKNGIWYKVNSLDNIAFDVTSNFVAICEDAPGTPEGYITETFEDTMIPEALGGSATTGLCDYYWRSASPNSASAYIPVGVGIAYHGFNLGLSCLNSNHVASHASANDGSALASDNTEDRRPDGEIAI